MATHDKDLNKISTLNPGSLENRGCRIGAKVNINIPAGVGIYSIAPNVGPLIELFRQYFFDLTDIDTNLIIQLPQIWNEASLPSADYEAEAGYEALFNFIGTFTPFEVHVTNFLGIDQAIIVVPDVVVSFIANSDASSWDVRYIPKIAPVIIPGKRSVFQGNVNPPAEPLYDVNIAVEQAEITNANFTGTYPIAFNGDIGLSGDVILNNGVTDVWSHLPVTSIQPGPMNTFISTDGTNVFWQNIVSGVPRTGFAAEVQYILNGTGALIDDITPIIGSSAVAPRYNTGMYNDVTGVATVPITGEYIVKSVVQLSNGQLVYIDYLATIVRINTVPTFYRYASDKFQQSEDSTAGSSFLLSLTAGDQIDIQLEYHVVNGPGGNTPVRINYGMHLLSVP